MGNAIIGGFENPTHALMCASGYLHTLRDLSIDAYACINMGTAAIRQRENSDWVELVTDSISPEARLEPLANPGEVLVLEELQSHPGTEFRNRHHAKFASKYSRIYLLADSRKGWAAQGRLTRILTLRSKTRTTPDTSIPLI
ncbi:MAG: hypothetical protein V3V55_06195, partial [Rhodospirillales bacterium]